jgi:hypothetical protein
MKKVDATSSDLYTIETEQCFEVNSTDKLLSTAAFLVFFIAVISQWAYGFYAADYYDGTALQHRLEIANQQLAVTFNCPTKKI